MRDPRPPFVAATLLFRLPFPPSPLRLSHDVPLSPLCSISFLSFLLLLVYSSSSSFFINAEARWAVALVNRQMKNYGRIIVKLRAGWYRPATTRRINSVSRFVVVNEYRQGRWNGKAAGLGPCARRHRRLIDAAQIRLRNNDRRKTCDALFYFDRETTSDLYATRITSRNGRRSAR